MPWASSRREVSNRALAIAAGALLVAGFVVYGVGSDETATKTAGEGIGLFAVGLGLVASPEAVDG